MCRSMAAVFSSVVLKAASDSASVGRLIKDIAVASAGAAAMKNPAVVKTIESADKVRS